MCVVTTQPAYKTELVQKPARLTLNPLPTVSHSCEGIPRAILISFSDGIQHHLKDGCGFNLSACPRRKKTAVHVL